jgi:drug/metabolite transporter (DMT)-like permease
LTRAVAGTLLALVVIWGSAFPIIKVALEGLSAPHLTLARHLVASFVLFIFLAISGCRLFPLRSDIPYFFLIGLVGITIYHLALNFGELRVSAGGASLIMASAPALTAILSYLLFSEKFGFHMWLGSAISFSGVVVIVFGEDRFTGLNLYAGFVVLSSFATAIFFVLQKRLFIRYRPVEVTAFATWAGTIPLIVFLPGLGTSLAKSGLGPILATVYAGVFPSAIAYSLLAYALSRTNASLVATFLYAVPVFSLIFSWVLLDEVAGWLTLLGGAVVLGGIVVVNQGWTSTGQRKKRRQFLTGKARRD